MKGRGPAGVTPEQLADLYPRLYHMAAEGSWRSIRRHGLLCTSALLTLFEVVGEERRRIEEQHRPTSVLIEHPRLGRAVVRDQIPMRERDLERCLCDEMTPREWYRALNAKVFFWPTVARLEKFLGARAYRNQSHLVLTLDTLELVTALGDRVWLSPINSGATRPRAFPRGRGTFARLQHYPFWERRKYGRAGTVAEVALDDSVPDVERFVLEVRMRSAHDGGRVLWHRSNQRG